MRVIGGLRSFSAVEKQTEGERDFSYYILPHPNLPKSLFSVDRDVSGNDDEGRTADEEEPPSIPLSKAPSSSAARFDLQIARYSLLAELAGFIVLIASTGSRSFTFGTVVLCFAGGWAPSAQSLALSLAPSLEAGKLFGSLMVVRAIGCVSVGCAGY